MADHIPDPGKHLYRELGAPDREGFPGRSPDVPQVRGEAWDRCLLLRPGRHQPDPRPPRRQAAWGPQTATGRARSRTRAGRRGGLGDRRSRGPPDLRLTASLKGA